MNFGPTILNSVGYYSRVPTFIIRQISTAAQCSSDETRERTEKTYANNSTSNTLASGIQVINVL